MPYHVSFQIITQAYTAVRWVLFTSEMEIVIHNIIAEEEPDETGLFVAVRGKTSSRQINVGLHVESWTVICHFFTCRMSAIEQTESLQLLNKIWT